MSNYHDYSKPKIGSKFKVLGFTRISTVNQDEKSLDDQEAFFREYLDRNFGEGAYSLEVISGQGSGQIVDREEFLELGDKITSGNYDIVVAEDLSRFSRRVHAILLCEEAEDFDTRLIAINDHIDTAEPNWKQASFFVSLQNESFCKDTSERIKRSLRNRFKNGEIFQCEIYGYIKPHAGATDSEVYKDPNAEPIYDEWFSRLEEGQNYRMVADWLNDLGIPTGPYCRLSKWDGAMVKRITFSEILKGERIRNKRVADRKNKTGRAKTKKAPPGHQLSRIVPTLAFIEPERYDRVIRLLKRKNRKYKRSETERNDPRAGIPKRFTRFPGQLCLCGVCGRLFVFGGHGKKERLMCNGVRDYNCWNAMTISGPDVAAAVSNQIREFIQNIEGFEDAQAKEYEQQRKSFASKAGDDLNVLRGKLVSNERKLVNQHETLEMVGASLSIANRIVKLEKEAERIKDDIYVLEREVEANPELPSLDAIKKEADKVFSELALDSVEFANIMRKAITDMYVLPYRLVDGGHVQPRVIFSVALASFLPDKHADLPLLRFDGAVELMKQPVRVRIRREVVAMVDKGMKQLEIATELGVTKTEVANAMALQRCMIANGVEDPWIPMTSVDEVRDYFKRVRNSRFDFKPLEGFEITKHPHD